MEIFNLPRGPALKVAAQMGVRLEDYQEESHGVDHTRDWSAAASFHIRCGARNGAW
jgi:hypothetical protein